MTFSKKWIAALASTFVLTGCVSMNADDCKTADWAALGRDDALHGRSTDTTKLRADECRKFGYAINWTAPAAVDKPQPHARARSNASGLTPPR